MRFTICLCVAALLCAGSPVAAKSAKHGRFQLNRTSWTFTDKKNGKVVESVDADGNYISQTRAGKHLDHGTAVMKDDKACFTSKMTQDGEICWTTSPVKIGHSILSTSDKGEKLKVKRVKYVALKMPG